MSKRLSNLKSVASTERKTLRIAGGQVTNSSDGYVEYNASQQEDTTYQDLRESSPQQDATYQDIGEQLSESPGGNASGCGYAYESVNYRDEINQNDDAEYEEVKNK